MSKKILATATDLERMGRYISEYWCSPGYEVNPETLEIEHPECDIPTDFGVERHRGGFRFFHEATSAQRSGS